MKKVQVFFIYADDCEHCQQALSTIEKAMSQVQNIACEILRFKYNTQVAVNIAVNNGINDLPGFVIGKKVFNGDDYSLDRIIDAIKKDANDGEKHSHTN